MLIRNTILADGSRVDISVQGKRFAAIVPAGAAKAAPGEETFDATGLLALPPFYNCHTHVPMVLLRGYADDLELHTWLNDHIWPAEAKLVPEDIYHGTRLALLEMIKSGTVFFRDTYFMGEGTIRAAEEMGLRAAVGTTWLDLAGDGNPKLAAANDALFQRFFAGEFDPRVTLEYGPHAIYTVPEKNLRDFARLSAEKNVPVHIHLAETKKEFDDCQAAHGGLTPVAYLAEVGLLNERARLAHCVWLTERDIELLASSRAAVAINATSNLKLCSGMPPIAKLLEAGVRVTIGTDGCASNNAHSMFSEMKIAALTAKIQSGKPTAGKAEEIFRAATTAGAELLFDEPCGVVEGAPADAMFIDLEQPYLIGDYNWCSNLVYAGESSCVDSLLCDGRLLMTHRHVDNEEEIMRLGRKACDKFRR